MSIKFILYLVNIRVVVVVHAANRLHLSTETYYSEVRENPTSAELTMKRRPVTVKRRSVSRHNA